MESIITKALEKDINISNAGLIIISSYIKLLFERLNLLNNDDFKSLEDQTHAVYYLHYITSGLTETEEQFLMLNKVLCGIDPKTPLKKGLVIMEDEKQLIDELIEAVINYWPAIGKCSINGFRGNWLVREGILVEEQECWLLTIEKRAYDILLNKSPFSFSLIKLPWMLKPLHVNWTY